MVQRQTIFNNTTVYTASLIFQKVLAFFYFIALARSFGVEDVGRYSFAISFTLLFSMLTDFGVSSYIIRETSKSEDALQKLFSTAFPTKLTLTVLTLAIIALAVFLGGYPSDTVVLIILAAIVMCADMFALLFYGILRGRQNLRYESIAMAIYQLGVVVVGGWLMYQGTDLLALMAVLMAASIANVGYAGYMVLRRLGYVCSWSSYRLSDALRLLRIAFPFALAGIFVKIYSYLDTVLLGIMKDTVAVGLYSVPYKLTFALQFLPMAFGAAMYPAMSRAYAHAPDRLAKIFKQNIFYLWIFALPTAIGIYLLAPECITLLYGATYAASVPALRILILSLPFVFLSFPFGALLNATDRQVTNTRNFGIVMVVNILLNLALIPRFSFIGASGAGLITYICLAALGYWETRTTLSQSDRFYKDLFLKSSIATLGMACGILLIRPWVWFPVTMLVGAPIFISFFALLKGFSAEDMRQLRRFLHWRAS